jgi:hypothetical protein
LEILIFSGSSATVNYKMIDLGSAVRVQHFGLGDEAITGMENISKTPGHDEGFPG